MKLNRRHLVLAAAAGFSGVGLARKKEEAVDDWPSAPVKIIVPSVPGGGLDVLARLLEGQLRSAWKQPLVLDYKPGAGTITGNTALARSAANGYTLGVFATGPLSIHSVLRKDMPFDVLRDIAGTLLASAHTVMAATAKLPVGNLAELVAYGRQYKGRLTYATPGVGTTMHLAGEFLNLLTGIEMQHIPYKGTAVTYPDVIEGRVDLMINPLHDSALHLQRGLLKPMAIMGIRRSPLAPRIPAAQEIVSDFDFDFSMNYGVGLARATPQEILGRVNADLNRAIRSEEVSARLREIGMTVTGSTPEEFDDHMRRSFSVYSDIAARTRMRLD